MEAVRPASRREGGGVDARAHTSVPIRNLSACSESRWSWPMASRSSSAAAQRGPTRAEGSRHQGGEGMDILVTGLYVVAASLLFGGGLIAGASSEIADPGGVGLGLLTVGVGGVLLGVLVAFCGQR